MISVLWNCFVRNVIVVLAVVVMFHAPQCSSSDTFYVNSRGNGGGGNSDEDSDSNHRDYSMLCMDIKPQHSVDIEQIMGMWYGSEIIKHTPDIPGTFHINSCVVIHISDVTQQMQMSTRSYNYNSYSRSKSTGTYQQQQQQAQQQSQQQSQQQQQTPQRQQQHNQQNQQQQQQQQSPLWSPKYLRLIWSEKDDHLEYTFNYTEFSPGLWTNVDDQRGSLVALNKYTQFHGTVQVVKAVHDHLVLTFCGSDEKSLIYTIVLSRQEQGLSSEELRSIRNLLSRRGLSTATIHKVCTSGAANLPISELLLMLGLFYVATRQQWK